MKGTVETRRRYATEALFSERRQALPIILKLCDEDEKELRQIAFDAVYRNPRASWPILVRMAKGGSVTAFELAGSYKYKADALTEELKDSPYVTARLYSFTTSRWHLPLTACS